MNSQMIRAWETDEGIRFRENLLRHELREKWRKIRIAEDEYKLPEYDRPLKAMPRTKKMSIISYWKLLIP